MNAFIHVELEYPSQYVLLCRALAGIGVVRLSGKEPRRDALFCGSGERDTPYEIVEAIAGLAWWYGIWTRRITALQAISREYPSSIPNPEAMLHRLVGR